MSWTSAADFVAMGGHALYVWGAYAMTALTLAWEALLLLLRRRSLGVAQFSQHTLGKAMDDAAGMPPAVRDRITATIKAEERG